MKDIKIFLASSIVDFEKERQEIHAFIQDIENMLQTTGNIFISLIKCENMDNRVEAERKQNVYNKEIESSHIILFLFDKTAGDYTLEELDTAAAAFKHNNIAEQVCVFCRINPYTSEDKGLKKLAERLTEYRIPYKIFNHIDTVKSVLALKLLKLIWDNTIIKI